MRSPGPRRQLQGDDSGSKTHGLHLGGEEARSQVVEHDVAGAVGGQLGGASGDGGTGDRLARVIQHLQQQAGSGGGAWRGIRQEIADAQGRTPVYLGDSEEDSREWPWACSSRSALVERRGAHPGGHQLRQRQGDRPWAAAHLDRGRPSAGRMPRQSRARRQWPPASAEVTACAESVDGLGEGPWRQSDSEADVTVACAGIEEVSKRSRPWRVCRPTCAHVELGLSARSVAGLLAGDEAIRDTPPGAALQCDTGGRGQRQGLGHTRPGLLQRLRFTAS